MESKTEELDELKTTADDESLAAGYVADASQHATVRDDEEKPMVDAETPGAGATSTNALRLQGSFGLVVCPSSASITTAGGKLLGDETTGADGEGAVADLAPSSQSSFVNHGLVAWEMNREKWLERESKAKIIRHAKPLNVDEIIDTIFSTPQQLRITGGISEKFPESVPLPQLVDVLQDLWEAESV